MAFTESQRLQVLHWFEEAMGPERAAVLMDMLPVTGWKDIASHRDLDHVGRELRSEMAELRLGLRSDMAGLRTELKDDMAGLRTEMAELRGTMAGLPGQIGRSMITWLLASQTVTVGVLAGLMGFLLR